LKDSLPNCSIDPNQIGQVIQNVVINATQAMPKGGEILISVIDTRIDTAGNPDLKPGRYIRISVEDQGTGIPPDILPRIFDPYFTTKSTGSGLGLAISFSIVKKHGGIIRAESVLGKGSTIHILLPAVDDPANQSPLLFGHPIRGSGRILVMDDEPAILKSYSAGLIKAGYSVETAAKGEEALEIFHACLREGRPLDAAILDLTIPGGMGGIQCAGEIRKTDTRIPLIVASGYSEDPVFSDPAHYGFTAGIPKPFEFNDLLYLLSRVIPARKTDP
jgi:CheY-like chemotaxis protein